MSLADCLHRAREAFAARGQLHAEALAGFLDPTFGGGLIEWSVDGDPFAFRQFGAQERGGGHHLHQGEVGHEEDCASALRRHPVFGTQHAFIHDDTVADFGFRHQGRGDGEEAHLGRTAA